MSKLSTRMDAHILCKKMYDVLEPLGIFPALTGGLLYKGDCRKDIDIVLYTHRQNTAGIIWSHLTPVLAGIGITDIVTYGFVTKAHWDGHQIDIFNPELSVAEAEDAYGEEVLTREVSEREAEHQDSVPPFPVPGDVL